ncbi:MAG: sensor domain-containing diguanylate cyclase [Candidatus Omnitrophota bacterium]
MYSQKYRIACTFISVALFIGAVSFFIFGFSQKYIGSDFPKHITPYCFMLLSLGLLFIWHGVGISGAMAFIALSVPLIMLASLTLNSLVFNFQIIMMIGLSIPAYIFYKKERVFLLEKNTKIEKIQEEQNLLDSRTSKNTELIDALSKKLDRYGKLKDLGEAFNAKLSLDEIYQLTVQRAWEIIGKTDEGKLFLVAKDTQGLSLCFSKPAQHELIPDYQSADVFDSWVINKRQPLHITDATKDFRFDFHKYEKSSPPAVSLIIVPLIMQKRRIGILRLGSKAPEAYTADDLRLLDFISDLSSAAINNAHLYIRTQELAIKDSLTGLYLYRYFKERLTEEFIRCRKANAPLSIVMVDIDHFKDYNDKYGHAAGDKVLKGIAGIMRKNVNQTNILSRYGGEEFVVLFPGIEKKNAAKAAESVRKDIEATSFILRRQETKITVSAGVASFPDEASSEKELLERVDFLLYKAKKEGRNKVCIS